MRTTHKKAILIKHQHFFTGFPVNGSPRNVWFFTKYLLGCVNRPFLYLAVKWANGWGKKNSNFIIKFVLSWMFPDFLPFDQGRIIWSKLFEIEVNPLEMRFKTSWPWTSYIFVEWIYKQKWLNIHEKMWTLLISCSCWIWFLMKVGWEDEYQWKRNSLEFRHHYFTFSFVNGTFCHVCELRLLFNFDLTFVLCKCKYDSQGKCWWCQC